MFFRTEIVIPKPSWQIAPCEQIACVGSCFADHIGKHFIEERFPVTVNPFGVMYNPASVLHTLQRMKTEGYPVPSTVLITLGTNHVYILKETGEIVDNCQKRPQRLFEEQVLSVDACADYLRQCMDVVREMNPEVRVVFTVSPIRYAKYGYHGSQLSKSTLLLAIDQVLSTFSSSEKSVPPGYFPAYEILNDELRDYRFYAPDMLHPSQQAIDYIWERFVDAFFSKEAKQYLSAYKPLKQALQHKPFHPESDEYQQFLKDTQERLEQLRKKYPGMC